MGEFKTWLERCKAEDPKFDINAVRDNRAGETIRILKAHFNAKGMTLLHYAVLYGRWEIMTLFLENNASMYLGYSSFCVVL